MIRFACIYCGVKFAVQPTSAGKTIRCHGCEKRVGVPLPERAAVVEDDEDDDDIPVAKAVETKRKPAPRDRRPAERPKRGLVAHGLNGTVELSGTELIFDHDGYFGGHGHIIREGVYRHAVLGLVKIEYVEAGLLSEGRLRFVFGHERLDVDVDYVLDTQTITFDRSMAIEFLEFKKEVERFKRLLIDEIRMNNR